MKHYAGLDLSMESTGEARRAMLPHRPIGAATPRACHKPPSVGFLALLASSRSSIDAQGIALRTSPSQEARSSRSYGFLSSRFGINCH